MSEKLNNKEIADYIDWEGGLGSAFNAGLYSKSATDPKTKKLLKKAEKLWEEFDNLQVELFTHIGY